MEIIFAGRIQLSAEEKAICFRFNRYIFAIVLDIKDESMRQCCRGAFTTPCVVLVDASSSKDEGYRGFTLNMGIMASVGPAQPPAANNFEFDENLYKDAVVELLYHSNENLPDYSTEVRYNFLFS